MAETKTSGNEETTTTIPEVKDEEELKSKKQSKPQKSTPKKTKTG
jgi:hypothetical protein